LRDLLVRVYFRVYVFYKIQNVEYEYRYYVNHILWQLNEYKEYMSQTWSHDRWRAQLEAKILDLPTYTRTGP